VRPAAAASATAKGPTEACLEERCRDLADTLGLDDPVPVEVLEAAVHDETYAHNLLASRRSPSLLRHLLAHPPKARSDGAPPELRNGELAKRAAVALLRWGAVGFSVVDSATLERRRTACLRCPNVTGAPRARIYKLALADESSMICGLCGCSVRTKTKMPSESCPAEDPELPGTSRWGEPWTAGAADRDAT
jgi:hypothetical protein